MIEFICWVSILTLGNVLDWHTTYSAMQDLSREEMTKHEMNSLLAPIIHRKWLVLFIKLLFSCALIGYAAYLFFDGYDHGLWAIKFLSIMFLLVIGNNIYAKWADRHGKRTPGRFVMALLKTNNKGVAYLLLTCLDMGIAYGICLVIP